MGKRRELKGQLFVKDVDGAWTCRLGCLPTVYKVDCNIRKGREWDIGQGPTFPTCPILTWNLEFSVPTWPS